MGAPGTNRCPRLRSCGIDDRRRGLCAKATGIRRQTAYTSGGITAEENTRCIARLDPKVPAFGTLRDFADVPYDGEFDDFRAHRESHQDEPRRDSEGYTEPTLGIHTNEPNATPQGFRRSPDRGKISVQAAETLKSGDLTSCLSTEGS